MKLDPPTLRLLRKAIFKIVLNQFHTIHKWMETTWCLDNRKSMSKVYKTSRTTAAVKPKIIIIITSSENSKLYNNTKYVELNLREICINWCRMYNRIFPLSMCKYLTVPMKILNYLINNVIMTKGTVWEVICLHSRACVGSKLFFFLFFYKLC